MKKYLRMSFAAVPIKALPAALPAALLTAALLAVLVFAGCAGRPGVVPAPDPAALRELAADPPLYPVTRFGVISDPHFYDVTLGTTGSAFQAYLDDDRKLLLESGDLADAALAGLAASDLDFVLVCGDLTKDGEAAAHRIMAEKLAGLEAAGSRVYVVPGNHDIANGRALRYSGETTEPVPTVDAAAFAAVYARFGFSEAVSRDPHSLSYLAEPLPGLWLLALDSCRYREQDPALGLESITEGRLEAGTLDWLLGVLKRAASENKALLAFLHHGMVEHHPGQEKHDPEYLLEDYEAVGRLLAAYGVRVVFSGHDHAQDITLRRFEAEDGGGETTFLYDIETGSLATYPCPYRVLEIGRDQRMAVTSTFIDGIAGRPQGFSEFARRDVLEGIAGIAVSRMVEDYRVSAKDAALIAPQVAAAYVAHYAGDESPEGKILSRKGVGLWGRVILAAQKSVITGRWTDFPPADNDVVLDLTGGDLD
jgi:3',5'-cyclic AMP phosphodiesterase CpdA